MPNTDMKVFLSWSGPLSKELAEAFRKWLPSVLQAVRPYFSPDDIAKGARWSGEIAKNLEESKVGVFFVTADNAGSDWMMFEAGALSRSVEKGKVAPLLFGIDASELKGPYTQFQAAPFSKEEVHKLLRTINGSLETQALTEEVLRDVVEMWWPKLEEKITTILNRFSSGKMTPGQKRSERDMLEEVLLLTRSLNSTSTSRDRKTGSPVFSSGALRELIRICDDLTASIVAEFNLNELNRLLDITEYLVSKHASPRSEQFFRDQILAFKARLTSTGGSSAAEESDEPDTSEESEDS